MEEHDGPIATDLKRLTPQDQSEARTTEGGERERLDRCASEASGLARSGHVRRGYSALLRGYFYAERAMIGHPFAVELSRAWREAIDAYCEEYDPQHDGEPASDHEPARRNA